MGKDDLEKCEESFNYIDSDGSGEIDVDELERAMRILFESSGSQPEEIGTDVV